MTPAVAASAGSELEPRLTDGVIRCDERGNDVTRAGGGCHGYLRVHRRRGSSGGGEALAAAATGPGVAGAQTLPYPLHLLEGVPPHLEKQLPGSASPPDPIPPRRSPPNP